MLINKYYNIHNKIDFSINGNGRLAEYLNYQYEYWTINRTEKKSDNHILIDIVKDLSINYDNFIKGNGFDYCRIDEKFYIRIKDELVELHGQGQLSNQFKIRFTNSISKSTANLLLDSIFRLRMSASNIAAVHAACVSQNDQAILIPAWKSMGKTALALKFVQYGFSFLGDDRVWIDDSGIIYSNPRYVVIKDSNIEYLNEKVTAIQIIKNKIFKFMTKRFNNSLTLLINRKLFRPKTTYYKIEDLIKNATIPKTSALRDVLLITRNDKITDTKYDLISLNTICNMIESINSYEWNIDLFRICSARDYLFPDSNKSWGKEVEELLKNDSKVFKAALNSKNICKADIPATISDHGWQDIISSYDIKVKKDGCSS